MRPKNVIVAIAIPFMCIAAGYVVGQVALVNRMFNQFEAEGCQVNRETGMTVFPENARAISIETIFH